VNLLLDTHVWIWGILEPNRLSQGALFELEREEAVRWLSPISLWETHLLVEKGRIQVAPSPAEWVRAAWAQGVCREAALTAEVAIASRSLALPTQDPADRFIAATALVNGFVLVTSDRTLARVPGVEIMDPTE
jgi:PIN domain nuclease of toxin-antitoxin system